MREHELWVVNESVLVFVVSGEDGVDHVNQLVVFEDFLLWKRLSTILLMIGMVYKWVFTTVLKYRKRVKLGQTYRANE